jgi:predicted hydrocarbon binding protein
VPVPEPSGLYYPNRIARSFFLAMEDVMGRHGLSALLSLAGLEHYIDNPPPDTLDQQFDFAFIAAMSQALEEMYGTRGGRGMALRVGRASFARGIKRFGAMKGITDPAFRALPLAHRTELGLRALASIFTNFSDQQSHVEKNEQAYLFEVDVSPMAWGRSADKPVCHALTGIIQECLSWSTNGHVFYVQETSCRATGHEQCIFRINKTAIGQDEQAAHAR